MNRRIRIAALSMSSGIIWSIKMTANPSKINGHRKMIMKRAEVKTETAK